MAKIGSVFSVFLKKNEEPTWRKGLIVEESGGKVIMAVRLKGSEEDAEELGTTFEVNDKTFMLVTALQNQLKSEAPGPSLALECPARSLFRAYFNLEDGKIACTEASEVELDQKDMQISELEGQLKDMKGMMEQLILNQSGGAGNMEDAAGGDEDEDDLESELIPGDLAGEPLAQLLLQQLGGDKRAKGTGAASSNEPSGAAKAGGLKGILPKLATPKSKNAWDMPMLKGAADEAPPEVKQEQALEGLLRKGVGQGKDNIQALINLEILKLLKNRKEKAARSDLGGSDAEGSEEEGERPRPTGAAGALRRYKEHGEGMFRRPVPHIRRYVQECMEELGVEEGQPWLMTDMSKKLAFSDKARNLHRFDVMLRHILKQLLAGESEAAALQTILCLRALRQCKNDEGSWRIAWKLTYLKDPISEPKFSGTAVDLELIANYEKALTELEKKTKGVGKGSDAKGKWEEKTEKT
jgi:hypothetical protein